MGRNLSPQKKEGDGVVEDHFLAGKGISIFKREGGFDKRMREMPEREGVWLSGMPV